MCFKICLRHKLYLYCCCFKNKQVLPFSVWLDQNKPDLWAGKVVTHLRGDGLYRGRNDDVCSLTGML